jgi:hypothetical protein
MESLENSLIGFVLVRAASTLDGHRHGNDGMLHLSQTGEDTEAGAIHRSYLSLFVLLFLLSGKGCGGEASPIPVTVPSRIENLPSHKSQSQYMGEVQFTTKSTISVYDSKGIEIGTILQDTSIILISPYIEYYNDGTSTFSGPLSEATFKELGFTGPVYVYRIPEIWVKND